VAVTKPLRVAQGGSIPFVGRHAERAWLRELLAAAIEGQPRVALLEGESGVGKSRLLREFLQDAEAAGWQTLWSRQDSGHHTHSPLAATLTAQALRGGILTPKQADEFDTPALEPADRAERLNRLVIDLAARRQLVLVVDDLHLADGSAIAAFTELVRGLADRAHNEQVRVLLIATCQPQLPGDSLESTLARIKREPIVVGLHIDGLDEPETAELLRHALTERCGPAVIDSVQRASHGNPLFVIELAANLRDRDLLVDDAAGLRPRTTLGELVLPVSAPEAIAHRLESLAEDSRHVLRMAALYGDEFAPPELAAICPGSAVDAVLDLATRDGLIEARGTSFAFHHHLIRHALLDGMGPLERKAAHRRIADTLFERLAAEPDQIVPVALHLLECDGAAHEPIELGNLYERAGDAAMTVFARATAMRFYEASLATAPYIATLTAPQLGWLQVRTARVNDNTGNRPRARDLYFHALQNLRGSTDYEAWGLAVLGWERTFTLSSEPIPTDEYEREFAEASGESGRDLRIRLLTQRADALQLARDPTDIEVARQAVELAEQSEDPAVRAEAFATMGLVQMRHLEPEAALRNFDATMVAGAGDPNPFYKAWGWTRRAWPLILLGALSEAERAAREAATSARRSNNWPGTALAATFHHSVSVLQAAPASRSSPDEALLMIARSNYRQASFILESAVAWDRLLSGAMDEAADAADSWERTAGRLLSWPLRALIEVGCGGEDDVRAQMESRPWRPPVRGETDFISVGSLCVAGELAIALASEELAEPVYELLAPLPGRGIQFSLAPPILVERILGASARVLGRFHLADEHLARAVAIAEGCGAKTELALAWIEQSRLEASRGGIGAEGAARARAALQHFQSHDLAWLADRSREFVSSADQEKRRFQVPEHELNPIESDVLAEFARGANPVQIAQRLLLSERTVSKQLERAKGRLGIGNSAEAARFVAVTPATTRNAGLDELTRREKEVLKLIALGRTNAQIADELVISQHTAIRHVANILEKTGCANRTEAAGLVTAP
jgi:DNA-binding CsgD family transcriptional regulator/tetratricopeptide (TPR) repeat protein/type II secretory pathway predicted ATPase ExeA